MISNESRQITKSNNILNPILIKSGLLDKKTLSQQRSLKDIKQDYLLLKSANIIDKKNSIKSLKNSKQISKDHSIKPTHRLPFEIQHVNTFNEGHLITGIENILTNQDLITSTKTKKVRRIVKDNEIKLINKSVSKVGKHKPSSEKIILSSKIKDIPSDLTTAFELNSNRPIDTKLKTSYTKYISSSNNPSKKDLEIYKPKNTCISITNNFDTNQYCNSLSPLTYNDLTSKLKTTKSTLSQRTKDHEESSITPKHMLRDSSKRKILFQLEADTPEELHFIQVDISNQSKALSKNFEKTFHSYSTLNNKLNNLKDHTKSNVLYFEETIEI